VDDTTLGGHVIDVRLSKVEDQLTLSNESVKEVKRQVLEINKNIVGLKYDLKSLGDKIDTKFEGLEKRLGYKFEALEKILGDKIDTKFGGLEKRLGYKFEALEKIPGDKIDTKFEGLEKRLGYKFEALEKIPGDKIDTKFEGLEKSFKNLFDNMIIKLESLKDFRDKIFYTLLGTFSLLFFFYIIVLIKK
jgi:hypothetical protein